jgi:hypothetical protein
LQACPERLLIADAGAVDPTLGGEALRDDLRRLGAPAARQ